jgi:hypothetical protein
MNPDDLLSLLRRKPFEPFRIHLTDGTVYEVRHPDLVWVGRRVCLIGWPAQDTAVPVFERYDQVSLLHITKLTPVEQQQAG